ncbi:MAG: hypothetical protein M3Q76_06405, partial [Acidobacteriota bacterium]|nr:hypothetical protein [Acidobacteriota bacterium]
GSAIGLTGMAASLGGAVFTFVIGQVVDRAGYAPVFWAAGTAALVALLALVFLVGRVELMRDDATSGGTRKVVAA